jgi:hypothetical protein
MFTPTSIFTKPNIFNECFDRPIRNGCNQISMVSGWISSHLIYQDLEQLMSRYSINLQIKAVHGMQIRRYDYSHLLGLDQGKIPLSGKSEIFFPLSKNKGKNKIKFTHEKIYLWLKDDVPKYAFSGSANFTQHGIYDPQQEENLWEVDPYLAEIRVNLLLDSSSRLHTLTEEKVCESVPKETLFKRPLSWPVPDPPVTLDSRIVGLPFVDIPLFNVKNPNKSRGNSGINICIPTKQRPRTDVDAAEISIGPTVIQHGFFPSHGGSCRIQRLSTNEIADATIVSQRGKNLRTSDNQQLGRWIRDYLGQQSGVMVDTRPSVLGRKSYFRVYKLASDYFYFDL